MNDTLPKSAPAIEFNSEKSSGHFVRMYMFLKLVKEHVRMVAQLGRERMVAHDFANTSFFGSRMNNLQLVLGGKCADHGRLAWTKCSSSRRSPDEAMFHDDNADHSVSSRVFFVGWRMHHAYSLSKSVENPVM